MLSKEGLKRGSTFIKQIKSEDVGKLTGIIIKTTDSKPYLCLKIRVENGPKFWSFDCEGELFCPGNCK